MFEPFIGRVIWAHTSSFMRHHTNKCADEHVGHETAIDPHSTNVQERPAIFSRLTVERQTTTVGELYFVYDEFEWSLTMSSRGRKKRARKRKLGVKQSDFSTFCDFILFIYLIKISESPFYSLINELIEKISFSGSDAACDLQNNE